MTTTETPTTIPLNQLYQSAENVRRTGKNDSVDDLAASIRAHGLRQGLNAKQTGEDRFEVVAGRRRLRALKKLAKAKHLAKDYPVPCRLLTDGEDAGEISLVENVLRVAMHPADQFEAFRALTERGHTVAYIAERFGVEPSLVEKRMKLASVSPKLFALYRKGVMSLDQLMAFTVSDDPARQEEVWKSLNDWDRQPRDIRRALLGEAMQATDRLAVFVGLDAYVAAGGAVTRDLFDEENEGYLTDRDLVIRLATDRLAEQMEAVQAEGWKWVTTDTERNHHIRYGCIDALPNEDGDDDTERFAPEDIARAGAWLYVDHQGLLIIERGLIHPDDEMDGDEGEETAARPKVERDPSELPATLIEELTAQRTAALRAELANHPAMALAATVHALALAQVYPAYSDAESCLDIRADSEPLARHIKTPQDCRAHDALEVIGQRWAAVLPEDAGDLWGWCLLQPQDVLLDLLAYVSALSVDAVRLKQMAAHSDRLDHADRLADALALDMNRWYAPSVEGFYGRLSKATLAHAAGEAPAPLNGAKILSMKKPEAAARVARALDGSGWLPAPLRSPPPLSDVA